MQAKSIGGLQEALNSQPLNTSFSPDHLLPKRSLWKMNALSKTSVVLCANIIDRFKDPVLVRYTPWTSIKGMSALAFWEHRPQTEVTSGMSLLSPVRGRSSNRADGV